MEGRVIIAGAGAMGASLAQVYAMAGYPTVVWNRSESGLERARHLISLNQASLRDGGIISAEESEAALGRITFTTDKDCFRDCGLVVENILENLEMKQDFFGEISKLVPAEALLATNTSGLSITAIARDCVRPERFMGQHWLNPPHLLPVCEVVFGEKTDPARAEEMRAMLKDMGKMPIMVRKDITGFVINRLQHAMLREALYLVESGVASVEDVDNVLKGGLGLRYAAVGPFGTIDFGGVDTFEKVCRYLPAALCSEPNVGPLLHDMVEAGKLGVKSGAGFYDYAGPKADQAIRDRDRLYIELAKVLYYSK